MWDGAAQGWLGTVSQYKPDVVCGIRTYVFTFHTASSVHRTSALCMRFATLASRQFRGSQGDGVAQRRFCTAADLPGYSRMERTVGGGKEQSRVGRGSVRGVGEIRCIRELGRGARQVVCRVRSRARTTRVRELRRTLFGCPL